MMRILITGASGFIGQPLVSFLEAQGHTIISYSRTASTDLHNLDAVIHLAGEPLSLSRWTQSKQEKILSSRTTFTTSLINQLKTPPKVFISASAVGFYGDQGEKVLTEESPAGKGFLSQVCTAWEGSSVPLKSRGVRLVHARFGLVIGPNGGVLKKLLLPYKLGLGGTLGSGEQWMSWVARHDLIRALAFLLQEPMSGPVNIVSPHPVRQKDFAAVIANLLHRPHFFHLPASLLRLVFGVMADELLLSSIRVQPAKLLASKFAFQYADLRSAVNNALQF